MALMVLNNLYVSECTAPSVHVGRAREQLGQSGRITRFHPSLKAAGYLTSNLLFIFTSNLRSEIFKEVRGQWGYQSTQRENIFPLYSLMITCPRVDHQLWYFRFLTMLICLKNQDTFVSFFPNEAELKTHITYYPGYWFWMRFKLQLVLVDLEIIDIIICRAVLLVFRLTEPQHTHTHTKQQYIKSHVFLFDMISHDLCCKVSHSLLSHVWDCISTIWQGNVLAHVTLFHCPRHRVSYYFPHSFCTLAFLLKCLCPVGQSPGVTADISSERDLLLVLNPPPPSSP